MAPPLLKSLAEWLLIPLLVVSGAVVYGVLHDLVTAHVSTPYFSEFHPPVWGGTEKPIVLALVWGVIATWWPGLLMSIPITIAARLGREPRMGAKDLVKPLGTLLASMAICAAVAAVIGATAGRHTFDASTFGWTTGERRRLSAVYFAHLTSYGVAFFGGFALCGWIAWRRYRGA